MLSPQGDPLYRKLRPKLALSGGTVFAEDDRLHWHPAAAALATLHAEQKLTVMPAVGYTNADQSHFTSRHYWEVGATSTTLRTGWLGRYLDRVGVADNPLQGLSLDDTLAPALATAKVPVASIDGPDQYDFWSNRVWGEVEQRMLAAIGSLGAQQSDAGLAPPAASPHRSPACARSSFPSRDRDGKPGFTSPVAYPTSDDAFPRRLAGLAAMLGAGLPLRCVALSAPGEYDTHSDQAPALAAGLQLTTDSLLAFQRDLEARGLADRVLVHVWSEFGRRAKENGSARHRSRCGRRRLPARHPREGDDGRRVPRPRRPGSTTTATSRRRRTSVAVYAALLEQWFGTDAAAVLPGAGAFARPALLK